MKVIIAGATGFVGREVLSQCLQNPAITSIVALSRRELPAHDKLKVAIMDDFLSYPASVREEIKDASACIWTLGILPANVPKDDDGTLVRRVNLDYTMAAAQAFRETCVNPFQFVYVSGAIVERDQSKPLWYMKDYRRMRGEVETALLDFEKENPSFRTYLMRPAMIIEPNYTLHSVVFGLGPSIIVGDFAACMINLARKGSERGVWENADMNNRASWP